MDEKIRTVSILGAGNVAMHLAAAFVENTVQVKQVYNRTLTKAQQIGEMYKIRYTDRISELEKADLYVITTSDDAIREMSMHIPFDDCLVVHTSGSVDMKMLQGDFRKGVLYPLQTFTKNRALEYDEIPFFVEAENAEDERLLVEFAQRISNRVRVMNSAERASMHLAAVWVCNFVNHMFYVGEQTAAKVDIPFDYLKPLIKETCDKIVDLSPREAQTGPARRQDFSVLQKHFEMIENSKEQELYKLISDSIIKNYQ
ncbi:MAG: DUF2520 domain-containing protein [Weeksellaceae bacterium]|nr:DUF2520 domain-containing protein [Weeksellaceae bacterium]